ncbi:MAG: hypothetical protein EPN47_01455 [Acidobacteria bacterium]|nr:MAG: hypothetical protein EPN47_01455 [Acidobacteriota bacterium]
MNIIGCDLHSRMQVIVMLDTVTGERVEKRLDHESGEAKAFYEGLKEPALVGIESTAGSAELFFHSADFTLVSGIMPNIAIISNGRPIAEMSGFTREKPAE